MKRWQYQQKAEVISTTSEQILLDKWFFATAIPVRVQPIRIHITCGDFRFDEAVIHTPIDRWIQRTNQPIIDVIHKQHTYPFFFFHSTPITVEEVVTLDKWFVRTSEPIKSVPDHKWIYPNFVIDPKQLTLEEKIYSGTLFRQTSEPVDVPENINWTYPSVPLIDPYILTQGESILVDKWFVKASEPIRQAVNTNFTVTLDKWFVQTNQPLRIKENRAWVYPLWAADAQLFNVPIITYDPATLSFKSIYTDIVWPKGENRWQYPYVSFVGQIGCQPLWGPVHTSAEIIFLLPNGKIAKRLTDIIYLEM